MRLVVPSALLFAALAPLAGCELFGIVRCADDGDCPEALPFCEDEVCVSEEDSGRTGRGIDENKDGTCAGDTDCGKGLCYDLTDTAAHFDAALLGTCVPGSADDASCAEAVSLGGPDRADGGPAIFSASAQRAGGDCPSGSENLTISVLYLDREGDLDFTNSTLFVMQPGGISPEFLQGSISGDGTSGEGFFFASSCFPISAEYVGIRLGSSSPTSNALCVPVTGTP